MARWEDKATYVRRMFDAIAGRYDLLNSFLSFRRDGAWRRFAVSRSGLGPGGLALDVATGTAELARCIARDRGGCRVIGLDFSPEMLARAGDKLADPPGGGGIDLVMGDALRLPFPDDTFDGVTMGFALRNVASLSGAFGEMARVVKPGGRVVCLELTRPPSRLIRAVYYLYLQRVAPYIGGLISGSREAYAYLPRSIMEFPSPEEIREVMRDAGLQNVEIHRLALGAAAVHVGFKRAGGDEGPTG